MFACDICPYKTVFKGVFSNHLKIKHELPSRSTKGCSETDRNYTVSKPLIEPSVTTPTERLEKPSSVKQIQSVNSGEMFKCSRCPKRFQYRSNCVTHLIHTHLQNEDVKKVVNCSFCGQVFPEYKGLKEHLKNSLSAESCDKIFEEEHPVKCGLCLEGFSNMPCFEYHLENEHPNRPYFLANLYSCGICPMKQLLMKSIFMHVQHAHGTPKNKGTEIDIDT